MKLKHSILALVAILTSFSLSSYAQEYVAETGGNNYTSLQGAIDAATEGATVTVLRNIALSESITIGTDEDIKNIILDLNGKTIEGTDNATGSFGLININPGSELTINDAAGEGAITLTATQDRNFNNYSSVISNQRGKLTVNGGTLEHFGGTDMAYGIDNLTNGKGTYAETIINGGTIKSTYRAIRQFLNGIEAQNILTINGGTIEGDNKSIWMQDPSTNANTGTLTVTENAQLIGDVYLYVTPGSTEYPVEVSIAGEALGDESTILTGNVPDGNSLVSDGEGNWIVLDEATVPTENVAWVNGTSYPTLQEAIDAATEGATITLLGDIALTEGVTVAADDVITLELNGKTIAINDASGTGAYGIKNHGDLTIKDSKENGKITFNSTTPDNNYGYATSTIGNGGHLTVENGFIENTTVGGASYAIDGIWHTEDVSLTINDGTIEAKKIAVRQVPFSQTANNVVTINGGTLTGATAGLQLFNTSEQAMKSEVNITGGTFGGTYAFYTSYTTKEGSDKTTINIDGGTFDGYLFLYNGYAGSDMYPMTVCVTNGTFNNYVYIYTTNTEGEEVAIPAISGGEFTTEIEATYLAEGCELSDGIVYPKLNEGNDKTQPGIHGKTYKKIALKRTINVASETGKSNWSTFVVPFDMEIPEGWEVKTLDDSKITDEGITLTFADAATIEAGVPYMVRTNAQVETIEVNDVMLSTELRHTTIGDVTFEGVYTSGDIPTGSYFISGNKFYRSVNTENPDKIKGYRAYIRLNGNQASNARSLSYRFAGQGETEEGTTAIEATTEEATVKAIYTLDGTRISEMQQGVNILQMSNGNIVKVIIK